VAPLGGDKEVETRFNMPLAIALVPNFNPRVKSGLMYGAVDLRRPANIDPMPRPVCISGCATAPELACCI